MPVTVTLGNGQVLAYRPHTGLTVSAVLEDLRELGYMGQLVDGIGDRLTNNFLLVEGETYTFLEKEGKSWFDLHGQLPSASVLAKDGNRIKRFLGDNEPIYDLGRTSTATPLELTVDAFNVYTTAFQSRELNPVDWDFVSNVMDMSGFFDCEKQREVTFARHLESYLAAACQGMQFRFTLSTQGFGMPHIRVEVLIAGEWITVILAEVKLELGGGETCIEALKNYADDTTKLWQHDHWSYRASSCPVLILEIPGPHIRVGGAVRYLEKPAYQPFTPILHINKFLQDACHLSILSRALGSIGDTVKALFVFYTSAQQVQLLPGMPRPAELELPTLIRTLKQQGATVIQRTHPEPASVLRVRKVGQSKQLLFGVQQPGGTKRIIKFCQRYGAGVHQKWAAEGFAPQFTLSTPARGWFMINMEFYSDDDGWVPLSGLDPRMIPYSNSAANRHRMQPEVWEVCKKKVAEAYKTLREKFPLVVHGDLRKPNILYNTRSSRVAFIDFDWAGDQGQGMYPLLINMAINWPAGVGPCKPMTVENDRQMLARELGVLLEHV